LSISLLLKITENTNAYVSIELDRACFYCPLRIRYHWVLQ